MPPASEEEGERARQREGAARARDRRQVVSRASAHRVRTFSFSQLCSIALSLTYSRLFSCKESETISRLSHVEKCILVHRTEERGRSGSRRLGESRSKDFHVGMRNPLEGDLSTQLVILTSVGSSDTSSSRVILFSFVRCCFTALRNCKFANGVSWIGTNLQKSLHPLIATSGGQQNMLVKKSRTLAV